MIARITSTKKGLPNYVIGMTIPLSSDNNRNFGQVSVSPKAFKLLMKSLRAKDMADLEGKTFETEATTHAGALKGFLKTKYPKEDLEIDLYQLSEHDSYIYKIVKITKGKCYLLDRENNYWMVRISARYQKDWGSFCEDTAYLREEVLKLLMEHFDVKRYEELIGKEFRLSGPCEPSQMVFRLALKDKYPELV